MLATLTKEPFNDPNWIFEVKWDGYRILAFSHKSEVTLRSRSLLNYTANYKIISKALAALRHDAIIDGEIVVLDEKGNPSFDRLQGYDPANDSIVYYVFDLLWLDGQSLLDSPKEERKQLLSNITAKLNSPLIQFSVDFPDGVALFEQVKKLGMEGIVAKKKGSYYSAGKRSKEWLKIPTSIRQEFVIGGWTESDSARSFRSLLFGYYDKGRLYYQGHAGGGFKEKDMPSLMGRLKKLETKTKPFVNDVETDRKVHWVKPELVADVKYATKTKAGKIRKPAIFVGLRPDKHPSEVTLEQVKTSDAKNLLADHTKSQDAESNWKFIENEKIISEGNFKIGRHNLTLTNVEKQLWPNVTKADLIQYYHSVHALILHYLKNRPLSLHIKQNGPTKPGFYIKDMEGHQPNFVDIFSIERKHKKKGRRDIIDYPLCNNEASLLYHINLGCIDLNPWSSQIENPFEPDFISIDLDPSDEDFSKAIEAALATKEVLSKRNIIAFPKTSGKTGIHIYIPCAGFTFTEARTISENICSEVQELLPSITTTNVSINQRGNKLFLDPSQNDFADTLASAYSVRPHYLPTVSAPLSWKEINQKLDPHAFTITTMLKRINKKGDLFSDLLSPSHAAKNSGRLKKRFG